MSTRGGVCRSEQTWPNQYQGAPIAQAQAGGSLVLRYGGNGHSTGIRVPGSTNGTSGTVSVYCLGTPNAEITSPTQLTSDNLIAQQGFAEDSIHFFDEVTGILQDKGNWMTLNIPASYQSGNYEMLWVWSYDNINAWTSAFDVKVTAGSGIPANNTISTSSVATTPTAAATGYPAYSKRDLARRQAALQN